MSIIYNTSVIWAYNKDVVYIRDMPIDNPDEVDTLSVKNILATFRSTKIKEDKNWNDVTDYFSTTAGMDAQRKSTVMGDEIGRLTFDKIKA